MDVKLFDNLSSLVCDDIKETVTRDSQVSVAAACFSMYAYITIFSPRKPH